MPGSKISHAPRIKVLKLLLSTEIQKGTENYMEVEKNKAEIRLEDR